MGFTRVLRACGGAVLAGALVLVSAPMADASDGARAAEWPLTAYDAKGVVWPHSTGKGVVVAVIDSGVRATHVDLTGQVLPGTDLVHGGNGQKDYSSVGHGTSVASIIAGHGHGSHDVDGIMGLAPNAKILPIGVDPGNGDTESVLAAAIRYAVGHGAKVINMSLGSVAADTPELEQAVAYAESRNVVIVAASGNTGTDEDDYPASYPGVVSVGGVDQKGFLWSGSTSSSHLTVTAPAVGIVTDANGSDTQMRKGDGTSFSTAYVSAIAALIRSAYPRLTAGQVIDFIIKGADHSPVGSAAHNSTWGYGLARPNFKLWAKMAKDPGPAAGPLPQATLAATPAPAAGDGGGRGLAAGSDHDAVDLGLLVLAGAGGLTVLVVVIVIVLLVRRKNRTPRGPGGPPGPGGGYGPQPPAPYQQQPQPPQQYQPQAYQQPQPPYYQQPAQGGGQQPPPSVYQNNPYAQPQQQPQQPYYGGPGNGAPQG